jgi:hypothetical protein
MVDYEWKPTAFEICKVIGRLCKALVEVPTMLVEDMLKIKKKKIGGDALHVCSSLIIMTEGATSSSIANVAAKSVTQTDRLGGTS